MFTVSNNRVAEKPEQATRDELARLQVRYDGGAIPQAVFSVIRALEIELGWIEHRGRS